MNKLCIAQVSFSHFLYWHLSRIYFIFVTSFHIGRFEIIFEGVNENKGCFFSFLRYEFFSFNLKFVVYIFLFSVFAIYILATVLHNATFAKMEPLIFNERDTKAFLRYTSNLSQWDFSAIFLIPYISIIYGALCSDFLKNPSKMKFVARSINSIRSK